MKRYMTILLILLVILVVVLFPISQWVENGNSGAKYRISVVLKVNDPGYTFWRVVSNGVEMAARDNQVEVTVTGASSEKDIQGQIDALRQVLSDGPDAVVLAALDFDKLVPVTDELVAAGIKLITIDSGINSKAPVCHIATDNVAAGRTAGLFLADQISTSGKVAILSYVTGSESQMERDRGVREGLAAAGKENILGTWSANASEDEAYRIVQGLLAEYPDLEGVVGLNETVSLGAARAIHEANALDRVHLVAFDNAKQEVRYLEEGAIDALVVQKPFNMGYMGIQTAVRILKGETVEPFVDTGSVLITVGNMDQVENQKWLFPFVD